MPALIAWQLATIQISQLQCKERTEISNTFKD